MLTSINCDWQHLSVNYTVLSVQPDGASARPSPPSSAPGIPANQPCPARLDKQIGHSTGTAAVIGKKMDLRSENISPEHGRQIAQLSDIQSIFCRPFTWYPPPPPLFLTPGAAGPASIPEVRLHIRPLGEMLWIHLHSQLSALWENRPWHLASWTITAITVPWRRYGTLNRSIFQLLLSRSKYRLY